MKKFWATFAMVWVMSFLMIVFTFVFTKANFLVNQQWSTILNAHIASGLLIVLCGALLPKKDIHNL